MILLVWFLLIIFLKDILTKDDMFKKNIILFSTLIIAIIFLSGCNFFNGKYESNKIEDETEDVDFKDGEKMLKNHLKELSQEKTNTSTALNDNESVPNQEMQNQSLDNLNNNQKNMENERKIEIDINKKYTAVLHTEIGDITIILTANKTPITVGNFVKLARSNFYDNTIFHRAIEGFMIQGGDPDGNGTGGPGYKFDDEPFEGEYTRGTIAMANSGPNTNGSQFFIMHKDYPLPPNYVIFGQAIDGLDIVDKIATAEVIKSLGGENSQPTKPINILSIDILEE